MKVISIAMMVLLITVGACSNGVPRSELEIEASLNTSAEDFRALEGGDWVGTLEYLNYGSDQRSTIPVKLAIKILDANAVQYSIQYPGEEQYNAVEAFKFTDGGKMIDGSVLVDRQLKDDGMLILTTEGPGTDDGRDARIQTIYMISENLFRMQKNVRYDNGDQYFNRNEYRFSR